VLERRGSDRPYAGRHCRAPERVRSNRAPDPVRGVRYLFSKAADVFAAIGSESPTTRGVVIVVGLVLTVLTGVLVGWWQIRSANGTTTINNTYNIANSYYVGGLCLPGQVVNDSKRPNAHRLQTTGDRGREGPRRNG
jgi:hypothetical protein